MCGFLLSHPISAPIIGLSGAFVNTLVTDQYKICLKFPAFGQGVVLEYDRPPAVAVFDRPFEVYWHFSGTLQLKKNQNEKRLKLVMENWLV